MTAGELLARCHANGTDLAAGEDGTLLWEATADPPADLPAELADGKPEFRNRTKKRNLPTERDGRPERERAAAADGRQRPPPNVRPV
jgi:hypothetical protein